jgi:hypothetical protein
MASCAAVGYRRRGRAQRAPAISPLLIKLPRIAASRNQSWRFSAVPAGAGKGGRRIDNPP